MKSIKLRFYLVIFLAMVSLISVGFATWVATNEVITTAEGAVIVEDVLKTNNYITCSSEDITKFSYFDTGFVNDDGSISTTGSIVSIVNVNMDTCKVQFKDSDTLAIELALEYSELSLFKTDGMEMLVEVVELDEDNKPIITNTCVGCEEPLSNSKKYITPLYIDDFKDLSGSVKIQITYTFKIIDMDYYQEKILPILRTEEFNFVVSARLTGAEVVNNG